MTVEWITYKGKSILYNNMENNKNEQDILDQHHLEGKLIKESAGSVLLLVNGINTLATPKITESSKASIESYKSKIQKTAVLGVTGIRKVIFDGAMRFNKGAVVKLFDSIDEAKDWLIE